ncbi:hypothetical protein GR183_08260 [Stappia sp. GBMRC 2046]|uniref:Uncharacterized protein n=1 Tax=Stappia sediminis TaxID=2692190 RepID=A0A7X3LTP9_9HYPH|nr:hypothetical protein [Stappia sediminis]MXN64898.1 hypothetical protein [Stappia sediminis]
MIVLAEKALPVHLGTSQSQAFNLARAEFARPDLSDEEIGAAIGQALEALGSPCSISELVEGDTDPELREWVYSIVCLPQPRAPLAMPVQSFRRAEGAGALSRVLLTIRRIVAS